MATNYQPTDNDRQATTRQSWVRLVDFCREHGLGENRARRLMAALPPEMAEKRARELGGKSEWWVRTDALATLRSPHQQPTEESGLDAWEGVDNQSQTTSADGWLAALEELRADRDRLRDELREEQVARRAAGERAATAEAKAEAAEARLAEAGATLEGLRVELRAAEERALLRERQAEDAERARTTYSELLAEERAAWWQWCAYLKGLGLLRRLRGLPDPPEELARGKKRLMPPRS